MDLQISQEKESSHGSPLGKEEAFITKKNLNWHYKDFFVPERILDSWRKIGERGLRRRKSLAKKPKKIKI